MKVLFFTFGDCMHEQKSGGTQVAYRNYCNLQNIVGADNVFAVCIVDKIPNLLRNVLYIKQNDSKFNKLVSFITGRLWYDKAAELSIIDFCKKNKIDTLVFPTLNGMLLKKLKCSIKQLKIIATAINVEKEYSLNRVRLEGAKLYPMHWCVCRNEKTAMKYTDLLISLNKRDADAIYKIYGRKTDIINPVTFIDKFEKTKLVAYNNQKRLAFIGSMFAPNVEGITWFIENVMPKLEGYSLDIIGYGFEKLSSVLTRKNVKVIGTVSNLEDYYYDFPVLVMPIFSGSGMKVKTAEALMYGRIILASDEALVGYDVDNSEGIYKCNTLEEYVYSVKSIFESKTPIPAFNKGSREIFIKNHSEESGAFKWRQAISLVERMRGESNGK